MLISNLSKQSVPSFKRITRLAHADVLIVVCKATDSPLVTVINRLPCTQGSLVRSLTPPVAWVDFFMINPRFRILRLTFHRKSASKCWIREIIIIFLLIIWFSKLNASLNFKRFVFVGILQVLKLWISKVQDFGSFQLSPMQSVGCESKPWPRLLFCVTVCLGYYVTVCDDPGNPN